jgi:hypothetical protein
MQHKIKKEHAKNLKKGQTFQSEDGYCHSFEEYTNAGILTEDGELVEYEGVMSFTFTLEKEQIEGIKQHLGKDITDEILKEEIGCLLKEKQAEMYEFIVENLTEMI